MTRKNQTCIWILLLFMLTWLATTSMNLLASNTAQTSPALYWFYRSILVQLIGVALGIMLFRYSQRVWRRRIPKRRWLWMALAVALGLCLLHGFYSGLMMMWYHASYDFVPLLFPKLQELWYETLQLPIRLGDSVLVFAFGKGWHFDVGSSFDILRSALSENMVPAAFSIAVCMELHICAALFRKA